MIIEARRYTLQPGTLPEYLALFQREEGVLDRLLPYLRGFWFSESGTLNTVHHLWSYEDRAARATVRAAMAADPAMQRFLGKVAPMLRSQYSRILSGELAEAPTDRSGGVYDRYQFAFRPEADSEPVRHLLAAFGQRARTVAEPVCALCGSLAESGHYLREAQFVLRHASLGERERAAATLEAALCELPGKSLLQDLDCELLMPTPFSPWR